MERSRRTSRSTNVKPTESLNVTKTDKCSGTVNPVKGHSRTRGRPASDPDKKYEKLWKKENPKGKRAAFEVDTSVELNLKGIEEDMFGKPKRGRPRKKKTDTDEVVIKKPRGRPPSKKSAYDEPENAEEQAFEADTSLFGLLPGDGINRDFDSVKEKPDVISAISWNLNEPSLLDETDSNVTPSPALDLQTTEDDVSKNDFTRNESLEEFNTSASTDCSNTCLIEDASVHTVATPTTPSTCFEENSVEEDLVGNSSSSSSTTSSQGSEESSDEEDLMDLDQMLVAHSSKTSLKRVAEGSGTFKCSVCGRKFTKKESWKTHEDVHQGKYKYHCPHCNKGFFGRYALQQHVNDKHVKQEKYTCTDCGKNFKFRDLLICHMCKAKKK